MTIGIVLAIVATAGVVAAIALHRPAAAGLPTRSSRAIIVPIALSGPTMGSTWLVRLNRLPANTTSDQVQSEIQAVLDNVEREMSTYRPDSDLCRFNASRTTDWFAVAPDVARVAEVARTVSDHSAGAFDVTVAPLVDLWGFGPTRPAGPFGTIPSPESIDNARRHVGYRLVDSRLSPPALRKSDPLVALDFSGIAKGYAAELVGRRLDELRAGDYLVAVGGEMSARGSSPLGRPWRVGIETPTPGAHRVLREIELANLSLSTSGDYHNFFEAGGHRYCHEIDPATGRPVDDPPASVSVVHTSGADADAMATALMVLGEARGYALAERLNLAVLFITRKSDHFEFKATPQFARLIVDLPGE